MHVPPTSPPDPTSRVLFEPMLARYTESERVRHWLFDSSPKTVSPADTTHNLHTFSYACMYYPSAYVTNPANPVETPTPYLDLGDFLVCHAIYDGIAVGTIYTPNETHALAIVRDSVMMSPNNNKNKRKQLSSRPMVRNFAMDLRVRDMEILEFAWMTDHSLIVACRRLHSVLSTSTSTFTGMDIPMGTVSPSLSSSQVLLPPSMSPPSPSTSTSAGEYHSKKNKISPIQKLSADFLFFPVMPQASYITQPPLLRVTLDETPALCQLCGAVGVDVCRCHPSCKIRAPIRMFQQKKNRQQQQQQQQENNYTRQATTCSPSTTTLTTTQTRNSPSSCSRTSSGSPTSIVSSYASLSSTTVSLTKPDVYNQHHYHHQQQQYNSYNQYQHHQHDNHINQHLPNNINHNIHNHNNNHDLYNNTTTINHNNNNTTTTPTTTTTTTTTEQTTTSANDGALICKYEDIYDDGFYNNDNLPLLNQPGEETMSTYAHRIMGLNHGGAFFCKWFKRSACGTTMETAMTPRNPVPYQFITGTKTDTLQLISLYVSRIRLTQHSSRTSELMIASSPHGARQDHDRVNDEEQYQEGHQQQEFDVIEDADLDNVLDDDRGGGRGGGGGRTSGAAAVVMTVHDDDGTNNVVQYNDDDGNAYEQQQQHTEPSSYELMSTIGNVTVPAAVPLVRIHGAIGNDMTMHSNNTVDRAIITELELCDDKHALQLSQQPPLQPHPQPPQLQPQPPPQLPPQPQQPHLHCEAEAVAVAHVKHERVPVYHHADGVHELEGEATPPLSLSSSPLLPPTSHDTTTLPYIPIPPLPSSLSIPPPLTTNNTNTSTDHTHTHTAVLVAAAAAAAEASDDAGSGDSDENNNNNSSSSTRRKRHELLKYCDVSALNKKEKLRQFMSSHVENVRCIPCDKTFSKRSNLVRHIETKHFSLRPFQCDQCSKRFGHNNHLRRHKAKLHNDNTKSASRRRLIVSSS